MNQVTLMGNLGADPEFRVAGTGTGVLRMRLATNERKKEGENWVEHTEWHTVVCFGKRAEGLAKILSKGSKLLISGVLRTRSWDDAKSGEKRWSTEVIANEIELAGGAPGQAQPPRKPAPPQNRYPERGQPPAPHRQDDTSFEYGANATDDDPMAGYTGG